MNIEELREMAMALPWVTERMPFGPDTLAFEIGGKMFCLCTLAGEWDFFNLKVAPELSEYLREHFSSKVIPAYHMNKRHWVSICYDAFDDRVMSALLIHARAQTMIKLRKADRVALAEPVAEFPTGGASSKISELIDLIKTMTYLL